MLFVQKIVMGVLLLAFSLMIYSVALGMPDIRSMGDVGAAFLPKGVALCSAVLALLYLLMVIRKQDPGGERVSLKSLALLLLFVATIMLVQWLGLPVASGLGAAATVLLLERGGRWGSALATGVFFGLLTHFGFGELLGVPLP